MFRLSLDRRRISFKNELKQESKQSTLVSHWYVSIAPALTPEIITKQRPKLVSEIHKLFSQTMYRCLSPKISLDRISMQFQLIVFHSWFIHDSRVQLAEIFMKFIRRYTWFLDGYWWKTMMQRTIMCGTEWVQSDRVENFDGQQNVTMVWFFVYNWNIMVKKIL